MMYPFKNTGTMTIVFFLVLILVFVIIARMSSSEGATGAPAAAPAKVGEYTRQVLTGKIYCDKIVKPDESTKLAQCYVMAGDGGVGGKKGPPPLEKKPDNGPCS